MGLSIWQDEEGNDNEEEGPTMAESEPGATQPVCFHDDSPVPEEGETRGKILVESAELGDSSESAPATLSTCPILTYRPPPC